MLRVSFLVIILSLGSCVSSVDESTPYGVRPSKVGYIPARMAVFSCLYWPERSTKLSDMPLGNYSAKESSQLCEDFDQYVASGFDNQPFMKGLSSKFVDKLIAGSNLKVTPYEAMTTLWAHQTGDCSTCTTPAAFYIASISKRKEWQVWLSDLAKATKGADAVLVPMILHYSKFIDNDRGMSVARRSAAVTLLLIDTSTGELIWSGGRESDVVNKAYQDQTKTTALEPPNQEELKKRLFTDSLWLGFPGRQVYK